MKRRVLAILLSASMILTSVTPAFASEFADSFTDGFTSVEQPVEVPAANTPQADVPEVPADVPETPVNAQSAAVFGDGEVGNAPLSEPAAAFTDGTTEGGMTSDTPQEGAVSQDIPATVFAGATWEEAIELVPGEVDVHYETTYSSCWYKFVPEKSAEYEVLWDTTDIDYVALYDEETGMETPLKKVKTAGVPDFYLRYWLEAGKTYYYEVNVGYADRAVDFTFGEYIAPWTDAVELKPGGSYEISLEPSAEYWFKFTPQEKGYYKIFEPDISEFRYYLYENIVSELDVPIHEDSYFLEYALEPGKTYYYKIEASSTEEPVPSASIKFEQLPPPWERGTELVLDTPYNGYIYSENWFKFIPQKTAVYYLGGRDENYRPWSTYTFLYDEAGVENDAPIMTAESDSGIFELQYQLEAGKIYYFKLGYRDNQASRSGITISEVKEPEPEEPGSSWENAEILEADNSYDAAIEMGQARWYQFTPIQTWRYEIRSSANADTAVYLFDEYGVAEENELTFDDDSGGNEDFCLNYTMEAGKTYWYKVVNNNQASGIVPFTLKKGVFEWESAEEIAPGSSYEAQIVDGRACWYKFTPQVSKNYEIFSSAEEDTQVALYDELGVMWGNTLASDDDSGEGNNFFLTCVLEAGKTYYYEVSFLDSAMSGMIPITFAETVAPYEKSAILVPGETYYPVLEEYGEYWFKFTPEKTGDYEISSTSEFDNLVYLYDEDGVAYDNFLNSDDSIGDNGRSCLRHRLKAETTYYYKVEFYGDVSGELQVTFQKVTAPYELAEALESGRTYYPEIGANEEYWFMFTPQETANYEIYSTANRDTIVYLYDEAGIADEEELLYDDEGNGGGDFRLRYQLEEGKTYYYKVRFYGTEESGTVPVTFEKYLSIQEKAELLEPGNTYQPEVGAGEEHWFKFTPQHSGRYSIYASAESEDTRVYLYDENGVDDDNSIGYDDDSNGNLQFRLTSKLEAGITYYYKVGFNNSDASGVIPVTFEEMEYVPIAEMRFEGSLLNKKRLPEQKTFEGLKLVVEYENGEEYRVDYLASGEYTTNKGDRIVLSFCDAQGAEFEYWDNSLYGEYYLQAKTEEGQECRYEESILFTTMEELSEQISLGWTENLTFASGEERWYRFTPAKSGNYTLYSTTETTDYLSGNAQLFTIDEYGSLNVLSYSNGADYGNFSLSYQMEEGTTYYYKVYQQSGETRTFTLSLEERPLLQSIEILELPKKTQYYYALEPNIVLKGMKIRANYSDGTNDELEFTDQYSGSVSNRWNSFYWGCDESRDDLNFYPVGNLPLYIYSSDTGEEIRSQEFNVQILSLGDLPKLNEGEEEETLTEIPLNENQTAAAQFVPQKSGCYRISASLGIEESYSWSNVACDSNYERLSEASYRAYQLEAGKTYYFLYEYSSEYDEIDWPEYTNYSVSYVPSITSLEVIEGSYPTTLYQYLDVQTIYEYMALPGAKARAVYDNGYEEILTEYSNDSKYGNSLSFRLDYDGEGQIPSGVYDVIISAGGQETRVKGIEVKPVSEVPEIEPGTPLTLERDTDWFKLVTDAKEDGSPFSYRFRNDLDEGMNIWKLNDTGLELTREWIYEHETVILEQNTEYYIRKANGVAGETSITYEIEEIPYVTDIQILSEPDNAEVPWGTDGRKILQGFSAKIILSDGSEYVVTEGTNISEYEIYVDVGLVDENGNFQGLYGNLAPGTYRVGVQPAGMECVAGTKTITVGSMAEQAEPWTLGSTVILRPQDFVLYSFVPDESGDYVIYPFSQTGAENCYITLYDESGMQIDSYDDFLHEELQAQTTYYVQLRNNFYETVRLETRIEIFNPVESLTLTKGPEKSYYIWPYEEYNFDGIAFEAVYKDGYSEVLEWGEFARYNMPIWSSTYERTDGVEVEFHIGEAVEKSAKTFIKKLSPEDEEAGVVNTEKDSWVSVYDGDSKWYRFVPKESGDYEICLDREENFGVSVYRQGYQWELSETPNGYAMTADEIYYICVDGSVDFIIRKWSDIQNIEIVSMPRQSYAIMGLESDDDRYFLPYDLDGLILKVTYADGHSELKHYGQFTVMGDLGEMTPDGKVPLEISVEEPASPDSTITLMLDTVVYDEMTAEPLDVAAVEEESGVGSIKLEAGKARLFELQNLKEGKKYLFDAQGTGIYLMRDKKVTDFGPRMWVASEGQENWQILIAPKNEITLTWEGASDTTGMSLNGVENMQVIYGLEATKSNEIEYSSDATVTMTYANGRKQTVSLNDIRFGDLEDMYGNTVSIKPKDNQEALKPGSEEMVVRWGDMETEFTIQVLEPETVDIPLLEQGKKIDAEKGLRYFKLIPEEDTQIIRFNTVGGINVSVISPVSDWIELGYFDSEFVDKDNYSRYHFRMLKPGELYYVKVQSYNLDFSIQNDGPVTSVTESSRIEINRNITEVPYGTGAPLFEYKVGDFHEGSFTKGSLRDLDTYVAGHRLKARAADGEEPPQLDENGYWMPGHYRFTLYLEGMEDKGGQDTWEVTVTDNSDITEMKFGEPLLPGIYYYVPAETGTYFISWDAEVDCSIASGAYYRTYNGRNMSVKLNGGQKYFFVVQPADAARFALLGREKITGSIAEDVFVTGLELLDMPDKETYYLEDWYMDTDTWREPSVSAAGARIKVKYSNGNEEIVVIPQYLINDKFLDTADGHLLKVENPDIYAAVETTYYITVFCGGERLYIPIEIKHEENPPEKLLENVTKNLMTEEEFARFSFTPSTSGTYAVICKNKNGYIYPQIKFDNVDSNEGRYLEGGRTYELGIRGYESLGELQILVTRKKEVRNIEIVSAQSVAVTNSPNSPIREIKVTYLDGTSANLKFVMDGSEMNISRDDFGNRFYYEWLNDGRCRVRLADSELTSTPITLQAMTIAQMRAEKAKTEMVLDKFVYASVFAGDWACFTFEAPKDGNYRFETDTPYEGMGYWDEYWLTETGSTWSLKKGEIAYVCLPANVDKAMKFGMKVTQVQSNVKSAKVNLDAVPSTFAYGVTYGDVMQYVYGNVEAALTYTDGKTAQLKPGNRDAYGNILQAYIQSFDQREKVFAPGIHTLVLNISSRAEEKDIAAKEIVINRPGEGISISSATVTGLDSYVYDGTAKTPEVAVNLGGVILKEGKDYSVSYENNVNAGRAKVIIRGMGEYSGICERFFTINPVSLDDCTVEALKDTAYTGEALTPEVTLKHDDIVLVKDKDYTVSYSDNVNAGTAKAVITGKGNYSGSLELTFKITPLDMKDAELTLAEENFIYSGAAFEPAVTVTLNGTTLAATDYDAAYKNNINAGTATVTVTGKGNYTGSVEGSFSIAAMMITEEHVAVSGESFEYTGTAIVPEITVTVGEAVLTAGTDYDVTAVDNINAGTAAVTVTGKGNYTGSIQKNFTITKAVIAADDVTLASNSEAFTGQPIEMGVTVAHAGRTLVKDTDYTVAYRDNINLGTAYVTVAGIHNYEGTVEKSFTISAGDLKNASAELAETSYVYDGTEKTPEVTVTYGNEVLEKEVDYTVTYKENINVGTAVVVIEGINDFGGAQELSFEIKAADLTKAEISLEAETFAYTGEAHKPAVTQVVLNGAVIPAADYDVAYENNVNAGTAAVTVTGKGNCIGSIKKTFVIAPAELTEEHVVFEGDSFQYTGTAIEPEVTVTANGKELAIGTDYEVSYENNVNAGNAKTTVAGKGNYTGIVQKDFVITKVILTEENVTLASETAVYTGGPIEMEVIVKHGDRTLKEGTDYTAAYENNIQIGDAFVTVTGTGNYEGTVTDTFRITAVDLKDTEVKLEETSYIYDGEEKRPAVTVIYKGEERTEGTDYAVEYADNQNPGTASVKVKGEGTFSGEVELTFQILPDTPQTNAKVLSYSEIEVSWNAVYGAAGYKVYRKSSSDDWTMLKKLEGADKLVFTDTSVEAGITYTYAVSAYAQNGDMEVEGAHSETGASVSTGLGKPASVTASAPAYNKVQIGWEAVEGAQGYYVYRKNGEKLTLLATISSGSTLTYTDTKVETGTTYTYVVCAFRKMSDGSILKGEYDPKGVSATPMLATPKVSSVKATGSAYDRIEVKWAGVAGAEGYRIYRKTATSGWSVLKNVSASVTSYIDTTPAAGVDYTYTVRASRKVSGADVWSDFEDGKTAAAAPAKPALKSIKALSYNEIQITWNKVTGAEGYRVYRKVENGSWKQQKSVSAETTLYTDATAEPGVKYTYTVRAYLNQDNTAILSSYDAKGLTATTALAAVTNLKVVLSSDNYNQVQWSKVDGAQGYRIYRKTATSGWTALKDVDADSVFYKDSSVKPYIGYIYTVRALRKVNNVYVQGAYNKAGVKAPIALDTVELGTVSAKDNKNITVTWSKVAGAQGYRVYRKTTGGAWKVLKDVAATVTSYADNSAATGIVYTYTVRAFLKDGSTTVWGDFDADGLSTNLLENVKLGTISVKDNATITLTWEKAVGAEGYRVYRKTATSGWEILKNLDADTLSYADNSAAPGINYIYTVRANRNDGNTVVWGGFDATGLTASLTLETVKLGTISVENNKEITLTWDKIPGVVGYRVYRKTVGGSWSVLKDVGASVTAYTDTTAKLGVTYIYTVRAKQKNGTAVIWGGFDADGLSAALKNPETVKLGTATAEQNGNITVTWEKVVGADGYRVYRKIPGGGWSVLKDVAATTTSYTDSTAKSGATYIYTVRAWQKSVNETIWGGFDADGLEATAK